jgi:formamidopyrimidine-DNA glycosylase
MPELPEVETTRRGIAPFLRDQTVADVVVRESRLRWPVSAGLRRALTHRCIQDVGRRGKYLLLHADDGCLIIHLGMSGSLRITDPATSPRKHDHIDITMSGGLCLRYHDPRRFGAFLWTKRPWSHPLLKDLGPEPWDASAAYLHGRARGRSQTIKSFIMDSRTLVGVGNIYASESLFEAGVDPRRQAGSHCCVSSACSKPSPKCWNRPSASAVRPCAILSPPTAIRAISAKCCASTNARGNPAATACDLSLKA